MLKLPLERNEPEEGDGVLAFARYFGVSLLHLLATAVTGTDPEAERPEDDTSRTHS